MYDFPFTTHTHSHQPVDPWETSPGHPFRQGREPTAKRASRHQEMKMHSHQIHRWSVRPSQPRPRSWVCSSAPTAQFVKDTDAFVTACPSKLSFKQLGLRFLRLWIRPWPHKSLQGGNSSLRCRNNCKACTIAFVGTFAQAVKKEDSDPFEVVTWLVAWSCGWRRLFVNSSLCAVLHSLNSLLMFRKQLWTFESYHSMFCQ